MLSCLSARAHLEPEDCCVYLRHPHLRCCASRYVSYSGPVALFLCLCRQPRIQPAIRHPDPPSSRFDLPDPTQHRHSLHCNNNSCSYNTVVSSPLFLSLSPRLNCTSTGIFTTRIDWGQQSADSAHLHWIRLHRSPIPILIFIRLLASIFFFSHLFFPSIHTPPSRRSRASRFLALSGAKTHTHSQRTPCTLHLFILTIQKTQPHAV